MKSSHGWTGLVFQEFTEPAPRHARGLDVCRDLVEYLELWALHGEVLTVRANLVPLLTQVLERAEVIL